MCFFNLTIIIIFARATLGFILNDASDGNNYMKKKLCAKELAIDYLISFAAGFLVAFGLHYFSQQNGFVPGGISGLAFILEMFLPHLKIGDFVIGASIYIFLLNMPFFVLISIFVEKKLGLNLAFYILVQSVTLLLLNEFLPNIYYDASDGNLIFACIGAGFVTGLGFGLQIRRNGSSGGTYSISALIKHWYPAANIAWLSFMMDCSVVVLLFVCDQFSIEPTIATIVNIFLANFVVDYCLQGAKEGYKFEIITDNPEEISTDIMTVLKHGVTEMNVQGMYTHKNKYMIVCIIRKRELSKMMKIIRKYKGTFASFSKVNEVLGNFKK